MSQLDDLIRKAREVQMTPEEREIQRQSFAYGNAKFENERVTRESVCRASKGLEEGANGGAVQSVE